MKRLTKLDPNEVSLVPTGANRKRFLVFKEGEPVLDRVRGASPTALQKILDVVVKSFGKKDGDEDQLNNQLDGLSPAAQTAARAIGLIAAPHADELTGGHVNAVLSQVGIDGGKATDPQGGSQVKPEHMAKAKAAAEKTYKDEMEKMGYKKYPTGELQMKEFPPKGGKGEGDDDGDEDEAKKAKAAKMKKEQDEADEAEKARKAKEGKVGKEQILKADGSINLDAVPAEMRPFMEVVAKSMTDSQARATAAEAKASENERVLKEHQASTRHAEIVRKSFEFRNLRQEDVEKTLALADKAGPAEYERVTKMFEAQNTQLGASNLFTEIGKAGMSDGALSAWAKIEKAADGIVQKSAERISKEMAIADFLATPEGGQLYAQHQASRPNGI